MIRPILLTQSEEIANTTMKKNLSQVHFLVLVACVCAYFFVPLRGFI